MGKGLFKHVKKQPKIFHVTNLAFDMHVESLVINKFPT